jgi:transposase-like protein
MFTTDNKRRWVAEAKETSVKLVSKKYGIPIKSLKRWLQVGPDRKKGSHG